MMTSKQRIVGSNCETNCVQSNQTGCGPHGLPEENHILIACETNFTVAIKFVVSEFLIRIIHPLSATFICTCRFNLLHTAITFHHFFTVPL